MPWSNQTGGGGGWKGGNGGPWGQGPRGSSNQPPDLEELLRRSQDRLKRVLPGGGGRGVGPLGIIAVVAVAIALVAYNFFTFRVEPDEVGIVLRFGQPTDRPAPPGLNFRLPYPIETVYKPKVTRSNRINVGLAQDDRAGAGRDIPGESLMLTGDENIVDIDFSVFWQIKDAKQFLFNLQSPEGTIKAVAESAMREVIGRNNIQLVLTEGREQVARDVLALMQGTLDGYNAGVRVTQVQLLKVDPPNEVIAAFRDVQAARADQERLQNEAQTYANQRVPRARGQASQITEGANAYRDQIIAEAQGRADRFGKVFQSYKAAPEVTRRRLYLETMEQVLAAVDKVIIDQPPGAQGVVPYLPLPGISRGGAGAGATNVAPNAAQTGPRANLTSGQTGTR